mgnify:CR=1 FL=1
MSYDFRSHGFDRKFDYIIYRIVFLEKENKVLKERITALEYAPPPGGSMTFKNAEKHWEKGQDIFTAAKELENES